MAFDQLSTRQRSIVLQCMRATEAYVDDDEKQSRLGLEPDELRDVINRWPNLDDSREDSRDFLAINNCLNEVCHGFYIPPGEWSTWFDSQKADVKSTYDLWLDMKGMHGGIR